MALNEASWRRIISSERRGIVAAGARAAETREHSYAAGAWLHRWAFGRILRPKWASVPIISVGNITVGGTGKTPLVEWLVKRLRAEGAVPAVLTRGYRGDSEFADEPAMLRQVTGAMVVVNADRWAGLRKAAADGADVCVLDDGFQHLRLARDLNIVVVDATCPLGYGHLLPRGLLREPVSSLRKADAIVLTRCEQVGVEETRRILGCLRLLAPKALLAESVIAPEGLRLADGQVLPAQELAGRRVWAFCGLGNPAAFYRTLEGLGAQVVGRTTFNDHHAYTEGDVFELLAAAESAGAEHLVATAKDAVKLGRWARVVRLAFLEVELQITSGEAALKERIAQVLASRNL